MTTLHTVNRPALSNGALASCLRVAANHDCVLLIEDGVYSCAMIAAALDTSGKALRPQELALKTLFDDRKVRLCALEEDLLARGIDLKELPKQIEVINYSGFVSLVLQYCKSVSRF